MTLDEIISDLKTGGALPRRALSAGIDHANDLAPGTYALAERFCRGVCLMPGENRLLGFGLHILAAARHPGLLDWLVELVRQPDDDLERLFPLHVPDTLAALLLSVWDLPKQRLFDMIEHADLIPDAKWALYQVLARLTFDGRIPRAETLSFLIRIEADGLIDDGDITWWGWDDAVCRLGLVELEPALRRVWTKPVYSEHTDEDRAEALEELRHVAAHPDDATFFDEERIRPVMDPAEALVWMERQAQRMAEWAAEDTEPEPPDTPAANAVRLTDEEMEWLAGFLECRQVPPSTMPLEQLDGFFTALVTGPELVLPSQYLPVVWGTDDGSGPRWEDVEQAQYVLGLLTRHWNAIAARRSANAEHRPYIELYPSGEPGEAWGLGFLLGVELGGATWDPIFIERHADRIVLPILALSRETPDEAFDEIAPEMREAILDQLPVNLRAIAAYWQNPSGRLLGQEPVRSNKIGRNDPCPCGSGKKYKKCCGPGATLH